METLHQSLANELLQMADVDQTMRIKVVNGEAHWDSSVDEASQVRLKEIVENDGWPTIPKVGADASHAAWLLVQHAPSLEFMERCLELMETLADGEVSPANIAYLKDRVLMMNDKPQIYGTQFQGTDKEMHVYPIENEEQVDERRASVGLGTFAESEARLRKLHKIDNKK